MRSDHPGLRVTVEMFHSDWHQRSQIDNHLFLSERCGRSYNFIFGGMDMYIVVNAVKIYSPFRITLVLALG